MPRPVGEILRTGERPVDAGRGDFEAIGLVSREKRTEELLTGRTTQNLVMSRDRLDLAKRIDAELAASEAEGGETPMDMVFEEILRRPHG